MRYWRGSEAGIGAAKNILYEFSYASEMLSMQLQQAVSANKRGDNHAGESAPINCGQCLKRRPCGDKRRKMYNKRRNFLHQLTT